MQREMFGLKKTGLEEDRAERARQRTAAEQQQQHLQSIIATLPLEQQDLARANPNKFIEMLMREPPKPTVVPQGGAAVGPDGNVLFQSPPKPESEPADVRAYQFAVQQGFKGDFQSWLRAKADAMRPVTTINNNMPGNEFGPIPPGYRIDRSPDGTARMQPIPGSPAAREERDRKTPAQLAVDNKFAAEYVDFVVNGGYADAVKQLDQLDESLELLTSGKTRTGPLVGNLPDFAMAFLSPDTVKAKEAVQEVVQRTLRVVLGAQFTEKEGERLIARAYNDRLSPEVNAERVGRLMKQIRTMADSKMDAARYYDENGTLLGWKGELPTLGALEKAIPANTQPASKPAANAPNLPRINNDNDYFKLPSGTAFIDPQGNRRRKP
jgi:hypothetical protein